ncbi:hypothetical protein [Hafnia alvei]|uniref:Uncharacterized protein n=1 Tax=Hafnia alvei TaxID=569 RepID=A0A1C6Z7G6_HAFAL|nr:hypothetical protein [Hafnia alvei]NLS55432.1 hypothetical protein [Hafnia alvei]SCM55014.1 hypothetical protein BN1044_04527 [Hafnia alvei]
MAIIRTEKENGENHLPAGWLSGFATLCGMSEASDTAISDAHEGTVTCEVCAISPTRYFVQYSLKRWGIPLPSNKAPPRAESHR